MDDQASSPQKGYSSIDVKVALLPFLTPLCAHVPSLRRRFIPSSPNSGGSLITDWRFASAHQRSFAPVLGNLHQFAVPSCLVDAASDLHMCVPTNGNHIAKRYADSTRRSLWKRSRLTCYVDTGSRQPSASTNDSCASGTRVKTGGEDHFPSTGSLSNFQLLVRHARTNTARNRRAF